jgi:transcription initiation factor TFIIE subunit alpha
MTITKDAVAEVVRDVIGEDAVDITNYLYGKERISEFTIAEEVDYEIHTARYILYKMLENNLATFIRRKDRIKGWYICYWTLDLDRIARKQKELLDDQIEELESRFANEKGSQFYMCSNTCMRMTFPEAAENNYKCPECGEIMDTQDNSRTVEFLQQRIDELKEEKSNLDFEESENAEKPTVTE